MLAIIAMLDVCVPRFILRDLELLDAPLSRDVRQSTFQARTEYSQRRFFRVIGIIRAYRTRIARRRNVLTCRVGWNDSGCPIGIREVLRRRDFDYRRVRFYPRTIIFGDQSRYIVPERIRTRAVTFRIAARGLGSQGITAARAVRLARRCFCYQSFPEIITARFLSRYILMEFGREKRSVSCKKNIYSRIPQLFN